MRQNIKHNSITYALLTGLLVCGFLFVATPVVAQSNTAGNGGLSTLELIAIIFSIVAGVPTVFTILAKLFNFKNWLIKDILENQQNTNNALNNTNTTLTKVETQLNTYIKEHSKRHEELKNDLNTHTSMPHAPVPSSNNSPEVLNEWGEEHFKGSGYKEYLNKNIDTLIDNFENIDTLSIIQLKAREVVEDIYRNPENAELQPIRDYVFEEGIPYQHFITIMTLGLRDMICEEKGIEIKKKEQQVPK